MLSLLRLVFTCVISVVIGHWHCREGHASMVAELKEALSEKPGCIIASVGGGGLLTG